MSAGHWAERESFEPDVDDVRGRVGWTKGRHRYATFLWSIPDDGLAADLESVADRLDEFDCVRGVPERYVHVTIKQVGFVVDDPSDADEVSEATLESIADRAEGIVADADPFEVRVPRLNLFPSVVFGEIADDGGFESLHRALRAIDAVPAHPYEGDDYVPHVTLAQFAGRDDLESLLEWLERNRTILADEDGPPTATVDSIDLVTVDPQSFFPRFRTVRRYSLE